jgi:quercetin 2,3-dioxygenase
MRQSKERGHAAHGWLDSYHSFSFGDYHDPRWMGFRSLRVLNEDRVAAQQGFPTHGHRDMEIITYILSGSLEHRDSMGNGRVIRAGDVQYMAAGGGVRHSEFNPSETEEVHFLQLWIQVDRPGTQARYAEKSFKEVAAGQLHLVLSPTGRNDSITINQDADLWLAKLQAGDQVSHSLSAGRHAWVQVAEGEISLNGTMLKSGDAAAISDETRLELQAQREAQVLLFDLS